MARTIDSEITRINNGKNSLRRSIESIANSMGGGPAGKVDLTSQKIDDIIGNNLDFNIYSLGNPGDTYKIKVLYTINRSHKTKLDDSDGYVTVRPFNWSANLKMDLTLSCNLMYAVNNVSTIYPQSSDHCRIYAHGVPSPEGMMLFLTITITKDLPSSLLRLDDGYTVELTFVEYTLIPSLYDFNTLVCYPAASEYDELSHDPFINIHDFYGDYEYNIDLNISNDFWDSASFAWYPYFADHTSSLEEESDTFSDIMIISATVR